MPVSQEVLDYINGSYVAGKSKEQIVQEMRATGYQDEIITQAFAEYEKQTSPASTNLSPSLASVQQLFSETIQIYSQNFLRIFLSQFLFIFIVVVLIGVTSTIFSLILFLIIGFGLDGITGETIISSFSKSPYILLGVGIPVFLLFILALYFLQTWIQLAYLRYITGLTQKVTALQALASSFSKTPKFYWTQLLFNSVCALGLVFLPITIIFFTWFSFYMFTFIHENLSGAKALLKSKSYIKGRFIPVFGRILVINIFAIIIYAGINIVTQFSSSTKSFEIIPIFLISFILLSLIHFVFIYMNLLYTSLKNTSVAEPFNPSKKSQIFINISPLILLSIVIGAIIILFTVFANNRLAIPTNDSTTELIQHNLLTPAGRDAQRDDDLKTIYGAVLYHRVFNTSYPTSLNEIELPNNKALPEDPTAGKVYEYTLLRDGSEFEVCANFETKERNCISSIEE